MKWSPIDVVRVVGAVLVGACAVACVIRGDVGSALTFAAVLAPGIVPHAPARASAAAPDGSAP